MKEQLQAEKIRLRERLQEKQVQLSTMESIFMKALHCRQTSNSYALFLKKQWLQFQIKTLAQYGSFPFQDYRQFIEFCNQTNMEDMEKLVEFYVHNLTLENMNFWDPNSRLGDMHLMALASWMTHEETRVEEVKKVMEKEEKESL